MRYFICGILLIVCFFESCGQSYASDAKYAVAIKPAPVLSVPDFSSVFGGESGDNLKTDKAGLIREVDFVALPGTVFSVLQTIYNENAVIYKVMSDEYPYPSESGYFIDSRFCEIKNKKPVERKKYLPPENEIFKKLLSLEGARYIWGGNYKAGIAEMGTFYLPSKRLSEKEMDLWTLKGVDCSGLLYYATNGYTPRNTSSLIDYGNAVRIVYN